MWDRLRTHKEHVPGPYGTRLKQKSQQDWEGTRSSSPFGYSVNIKGGPAPPRPPRELEYSTSSVGNSTVVGGISKRCTTNAPTNATQQPFGPQPTI
ncbi:hypothetical protein TruAng_009046 [Truncatella angustata]|nr:hypothetical protein TruAng_009046 [Truncatella angustata]